MADLINTLEHASEFDALAKLRPGEPYFLLIGRDALAPKQVQEWADNNRKRAFADADEGRITQDQLNEELRKSTQAEQIGWAMTAYKKGYAQTQEPKAPETRPTYSGHELPAETQRTDRVQRTRARTASAVNECVAALFEAAEEFDATDMADEAAACCAKLASLRAFAAIIAPVRPGLQAVSQ